MIAWNAGAPTIETSCSQSNLYAILAAKVTLSPILSLHTFEPRAYHGAGVRPILKGAAATKQGSPPVPDRVSEARESWGRGRTVFVGMTAPDPTGGQGDAMWSGGGPVIHLITGLTTLTPRRRVGSTLFHTRRPGISQTLTG